MSCIEQKPKATHAVAPATGAAQKRIASSILLATGSPATFGFATALVAAVLDLQRAMSQRCGRVDYWQRHQSQAGHCSSCLLPVPLPLLPPLKRALAAQAELCWEPLLESFELLLTPPGTATAGRSDRGGESSDDSHSQHALCFTVSGKI